MFKQSDFQNVYSTYHAVVKLVDQIIDLSKPFDTADHSILLKKFELYSITGRNLLNRRQFMQINEKEKTSIFLYVNI